MTDVDISHLNRILVSLFAPILLVAPFSAAGRSILLPQVPQTPFSDTESVTNAPLEIALASARFLRVEIALTATPSNDVEFAFVMGNGGALSFGDKSFCLGWDCGGGADERDESVSVRLDTDPDVLILR